MTGTKPKKIQDPFDDLKDPFEDLKSVSGQPNTGNKEQDEITRLDTERRSSIDDLFGHVTKSAIYEPFNEARSQASMDQAEAPDYSAGFTGAVIKSNVKNLASSAVDLGNIVTHPDLWGHYAQKGWEAVKGTIAEGSHLSNIPKTAYHVVKGLTYDTFVKPFIDAGKAAQYYYDTPDGQFNEQKFAQDANTIGDVGAGFAFGMLANKAIRLLGKSDTQIAKAIANAKSPEELVSVLNSSSVPALVKGADDVIKNSSYLKRAGRGVVSGFVGGGAAGFVSGDTSEERFNNALNTSIVGAILGTSLEVGSNAIAGGRAKANSTAGLMRAKAAQNMSELIKRQYPLESQSAIALDFAKDKDIAHSIIKNTPDNPVHLEGMPDVEGLEGKKGIYTYENPDGTHRVLADFHNEVSGGDGVGIISPENGKKFEQFGMAPGQKVSYKGDEFILHDIDESKIELRDQATGKVISTKKKGLVTAVPGQFTSVGDVGGVKAVTIVSDMKSQSFNPKEFAADLSPNEQAQFDQFKIDRTRELQEQNLSTSEELVRKGLYVHYDNGKLIVRNLGNNEKIGEYNNSSELMNDINANGINGLIQGEDLTQQLTGAKAAPGSQSGSTTSGSPSGVGISPLSGAADPSPAGMRQRGLIGRIYDQTVLHTLAMHPTKVVMSAFDNVARKLGLKSDLAPQFANTQLVALQAHAKMLAGMKDISDVAKLAEGKFTSEDINHVFNLMGTMSVDEMDKTGIFKGKPVSELTKQLSDVLYKNATSEERGQIYKYMNELDGIQSKAAKYKPEVISQMVSELQTKYPKNVVTLGHSVYEQILKMPQKESTILESFMRADGMEFDSPSRSDYLTRNGLDAKKFNPVLSAIDGFFDKYGKEFGIEDNKLLTRYISHIKKYGGEVDPETPPFLAKDQAFKTIPQDFFASLSRTGFYKDVHTDPLKIMTTYLSRGYFSRYMRGPLGDLEKSMNDLATTLANNGNKSGSDGVIKYANRYVSRLRGFAEPYDAIARDTHVNILQRMGVSDTHAKNYTNLWLRLSEWSAQGMKPMAGIRDMMTNVQNYNMRFGAGRTKDFISTIMGGLDEAQRKMEFPIPEASNIYTMSEFEKQIGDAVLKESHNESQLTGFKSYPGKAIEGFLDSVDKISGIGFNMSLQPWAYRMSWAGAYMESYKRAMNGLAKYKQGLWDRAKLEKHISLDSYEPSTVDKFNSLLESGKTESAAKSLAFVTGLEQVGLMGQANHPMFMDSRFGRMLGQFGTWPLWQINNYARLMSNGSKSSRVLMSARWAGMVALASGASKVTGLNFNSFSLDPRQAVFMGGPLAQATWFGANALGAGSPAIQQTSQWYMKQFLDPTRKNLWNPLPMSLYDAIEAMNRAGQGDPLHVVVAKGLGIPIDTEQYPRPQ